MSTTSKDSDEEQKILKKYPIFVERLERLEQTAESIIQSFPAKKGCWSASVAVIRLCGLITKQDVIKSKNCGYSSPINSYISSLSLSPKPAASTVHERASAPSGAVRPAEICLARQNTSVFWKTSPESSSPGISPRSSRSERSGAGRHATHHRRPQSARSGRANPP